MSKNHLLQLENDKYFVISLSKNQFHKLAKDVIITIKCAMKMVCTLILQIYIHKTYVYKTYTQIVKKEKKKTEYDNHVKS